MAGRPKLGSTPAALKAVRWADRYGKSDAEAARKFGIGKSSVSKMRKKSVDDARAKLGQPKREVPNDVLGAVLPEPTFTRRRT